jgi:hypothetical protein
MKIFKSLLLLGACLAAQCQAQSLGDIFRSAASSAASSAAVKQEAGPQEKEPSAEARREG